MAKELQAGKKPPGEGVTKPPASKKPSGGESATPPVTKAPAAKTRLAREVRATTLKTSTDAEPAEPKSSSKDKPAVAAKPVIQQQMAATTDDLGLEQTRHLGPKKPAAPTTGKVDSSSAGAEKNASYLGNYKLLKKLGQGGMGKVYKAEHKTDKRIVAVKVLDKELSKKGDFVQRFQRESRVMSKLDHPHVLRCFEVDEHNGYHYLAMEYVEGGSVEDWLKKLGRFAIGDALHIILKTAAGLQHAHEKSLIHRDIKPDNILLTTDGVVKVADLGLAKDTEEDTSLTKTGAGAGTPIYMAPEQARDAKHVDCRVDIYALGVMLYVFLAGQPPFQGTTLVELISAKEKGKFDPIRRHNDEVPAKIDLIVDKMLAKDPKYRFASCAELIAALMPLRLANERLSFLAPAGATAASDKPKPRPTTGKLPVQAAPTLSGRGNPAAPTKAPGMADAKTNVADKEPVESEPVEKDLWYWNMTTPKGKVINKKLTTDQIRMLIKSGGIEADAKFSKTAKSGYRAVASYEEFHGLFRVKNTVNQTHAKVGKHQDRFKELAKAQERRERWRGVNRFMKSFAGGLFGLLWILLIFGVIGLGVWLVFTRVL